jgi:hypothetical protein
VIKIDDYKYTIPTYSPIRTMTTRLP